MYRVLIKTALSGCLVVYAGVIHANEKWFCEPARVDRLGVFVMAPYPHAASFAAEQNQIGLVDLDIAKFSNIGAYSVPLNCEETIDPELDPENPVTLFACNSAGAPFKRCKNPSDTIALTFISDTDKLFVRDACESRLKKYVVAQEFDGVRTLVSEQKSYQQQHQVFKGTNVEDSADLKFNTNDKTLSLAGFTTVRRGFRNFYHPYRLRLECASG